jgi:hypothetical protein
MKPRSSDLPTPVTDILKSWFFANEEHPYPTEEEKQMFGELTGLTIRQVRTAFKYHSNGYVHDY